MLFLALIFVLPAFFGWVLGRLFRPKHEFIVACWALVAAAMPILIFALLAQAGDAISAAAASPNKTERI